jgi:glycosyltransferase involved in cell wall biosynthesis
VRDAPPARRLIASSSRIVPGERLDVLIHALAQLPDAVGLDVYGDGPDRARLEQLARAYAVDERVSFHSHRSAPVNGQVVYSSVGNASTAPITPEQSRGQPVVLDADGRPPAAVAVARTMAELLALLSRPGDPPVACRSRDAVFAGHRIALVTNIPAHYRIPLFNAVERRLRSAGASFRVFFLVGDESARPWMRSGEMTFAREVLRSLPIPLGERRGFAPLNLTARLRHFGPTTVLVGGFSPFVAGPVARYAASRGVPFGVWSGEITSTETAKSRLRAVERRWVARRAAFAIAYGSASGEYLRGLRAELPVVCGRNTSGARVARARPLRPETIEAVTVADMRSHRKGVDVLVDAFRLAPALRCRLTVIGAGRLLPSLSTRAQEDPRIEFVGALPPARVLHAYARSDLLLFPTREDVFGLVLAEAMGAGLATVVSSAPGAVADLAVPDRNCVVVPSHDPRDWAEALARVVSDHELRLALGEAAARTIENRWTMEHSVDALIAGLRLGVTGAEASRAPSSAEGDPASAPVTETPSRVR